MSAEALSREYRPERIDFPTKTPDVGPERYEDPRLVLFAMRIEQSELFHRLMHYSGRYGYEGPAVKCRDRSEVEKAMRCTKEELQRDDLGKGYVLYPKQHPDNPDIKEMLDFIQKGGTIEQFAQMKGLDIDDE